MQTSTNYPTEMHPLFPSGGNPARRVLLRDGLVLLPTANLWQVVSLPSSAVARAKQLALTPAASPELLFPGLEALREWFPRVHPKIENLLTFHRRPLTVRLPATRRVPTELIDARGEVAVRLIQDSFCYALAEDLESPLLATFACPPGCSSPPNRFGRVRSDLLRGVDHVVLRRQREELASGPAVVIRLAEDEDTILFL